MKSMKQEWDAIDAAEGSLDSRKWKLAERLAKENDAGRTKRSLAAEVERDERTVGRWIQVHRELGAGGQFSGSFAQAIEQVQGKTPEGERARKDVTATKSTLRDPDKRAKALTSLAKDDPEAAVEVAKAAIEATSDRDASEVASVAIDRSVKAGKELRKGKKSERSEQRDGEHDPNAAERSRVFGYIGDARRALHNAAKVAEATPWSESDRLQIEDKLDRIDAWVSILRKELHGVSGDWDEALAALTTE